MDFSALRIVPWLIWICIEKIYYLLIGLVVLILYTKFMQEKLEEPKVVLQAKMGSDGFERLKKRETKEKLEELFKSEEFKEYKRKQKMGHIQGVSDDDATVAELREKED